jgi:hypothetical protein
VCGYPSFFASALFEKLLLPGQTVVTRAKCAQWYQEQKMVKAGYILLQKN